MRRVLALCAVLAARTLTGAADPPVRVTPGDAEPAYPVVSVTVAGKVLTVKYKKPGQFWTTEDKYTPVGEDGPVCVYLDGTFLSATEAPAFVAKYAGRVRYTPLRPGTATRPGTSIRFDCVDPEPPPIPLAR